jgi:predicted nuclease of predicted toxin-antitoxin system
LDFALGSLSSELRPIAAELAAAPRVYVDANVPLGAVGFMRQALHWDVLFVLEDPDLRRASDREHFHRARDLGRTLITLDHDFFDARRFPPELSPGVVVCTAPNEAWLRRLLTYVDHAMLRPDPVVELPLVGRTIEVTPGTVTDQ